MTRTATPDRPVRRLVLLVYGMVAVNMAMWVAVLPLIPDYADDLGLSDAAAGALLTSASVTAVALSLPIGFLSDRFGARLLTIWAGVFLVIGSLAQAFATEFWSLLLARGLSGVAYAAVWTAGPAWIDAATSETHRSSALSGLMVVTGIGMTVGSALAGVLTEAVGQEVPFIAFAVAGLAVTLPLLRTHTAGHVRTEHAPVAETMRAVRRDRLTLVAVVGTLAAGVAIGVANLLVPLQLDDNGYGSGSLGLVLAASSALSLFASAGVTALGDRAISAKLVGLLLVVSGAMFVVPALTVATIPLMAFLILRGPFNSGLVTAAYPIGAAGARVARVGAGAVMGLLSLAWGLAAMVSPLAAGALSDAIGPTAVYVGVAVGLVALGAWTMTLRTDPRTTPEEGDRQVKTGEALA